MSGSIGLSLQEEGPLTCHVGGYITPGCDGARAGFGHCMFPPRAQIKQVQASKAGIDMSTEMKQNRESWVALWGSDMQSGPSTIYFDKDLIMGSNNKVLHLHIWGFKGVLPGHIYLQGMKLTKIFLNIYMAGVSDNEEAPAVQIVRTNVAMQEGQQEDIWGWGLEVTNTEEGRLVAERVEDLDWTMVQSVMIELCSDGLQHRLNMEGVGPVLALGTRLLWVTRKPRGKLQRHSWKRGLTTRRLSQGPSWLGKCQ